MVSYEDVLHFDEARVAGLPRTFIDCTSPALPTVDRSRQRVRSEPGWRIVEIATGHAAMVSAPTRLVEIIDEVSGRKVGRSEPSGLAETPREERGGTHHQSECGGIAPGLLELRHEIEVHAPDAGQRGHGCKDCGPGGEPL